MKVLNTKTFAWIMAACVCIVLLCMPAEAAVNSGCGCRDAIEEEKVFGPVTGNAGDGNTVSASPDGDGEYYYFNGRKYVISGDWGEHYLTGYGPDADGTCVTRSGNYARSGYTVSSTYANLGKVIMIKAVRGTSETSNISRYDGIYVCQDTGGEAVEHGLSTTMNTPVVDIYFDTESEADFVTDYGWITAKIYFLREVE